MFSHLQLMPALLSWNEIDFEWPATASLWLAKTSCNSFLGVTLNAKIKSRNPVTIFLMIG